MVATKKGFTIIAALLCKFCVLVSLTDIAFAGTYWASSNGTSTWSNCQSETPLSGASACTLATANANASAGDTVYLRTGTYNISGTAIAPSKSGTSISARITFSAYPGEVVNFVGTTSGSIGINLNSRNYIHVTGVSGYNMTFTSFGMNFRAGYSELSLAGSYNEIDHCEFGSNYGYPTVMPNYRGATLQHGSQYNYIHDNKFHDWQWYNYTGDAYDGPVVLEIGEEVGTDPTSFNVIENNIFYHGGHHVVGLEGIYNVFRNNIIHNEDYWTGAAINTYSANAGIYGTRTIYGYRNIQLGSGYSGYVGNYLVEGNRIGPSGISMHSWYADSINEGTQRGGTSFYLNSSNNVVRYNAIFGAIAKGLYFRCYGGEGEVKYNYVYNNTFYNTGYSIENDIDCNERFPIMLDYVAGQVEYNVVKNTLFHSTWPQTTLNPQTSTYGWNGCSTRPITPVIAGEGNQTPNLTTMTVTNNLEATGTASSHFVNPDMSDVYSTTLPDLNLVSGSAAIDGGTYLTTVDASDSGSGVTLKVADARYFQDGKFGRGITWPSNITTIYPDWIAVGTVANIVQINSINYSTNTITLANSVSRTPGVSHVWLYKKSDGEIVLYGSAPDYGAHEFISALVPEAPKNLTIVP